MDAQVGRMVVAIRHVATAQDRARYGASCHEAILTVAVAGHVTRRTVWFRVPGACRASTCPTLIVACPHMM